MIGVNCVIPADLGLDDLHTLMTVVGTYKGVSPYKPERKYGTFDVLEVRPKFRPPVKSEGRPVAEVVQ